jgi:hypothetical protein
MEPEKICPFMSRPLNIPGTMTFVPCQKEQCMAWVPEYRVAPTGIVRAHCKLIGLESGM